MTSFCLFDLWQKSVMWLMMSAMMSQDIKTTQEHEVHQSGTGKVPRDDVMFWTLVFSWEVLNVSSAGDEWLNSAAGKRFWILNFQSQSELSEPERPPTHSACQMEKKGCGHTWTLLGCQLLRPAPNQGQYYNDAYEGGRENRGLWQTSAGLRKDRREEWGVRRGHRDKHTHRQEVPTAITHNVIIDRSVTDTMERRWRRREDDDIRDVRRRDTSDSTNISFFNQLKHTG